MNIKNNNVVTAGNKVVSPLPVIPPPLPQRSGVRRVPTHMPVVIGGIGGSGTRIIAQILTALGYFMGSALNYPAHDNLWYALLFRRADLLDLRDDDFEHLLDMLVAAMLGGNPYSEADARWLMTLIESIPPERRNQWMGPRLPESMLKAAMRPAYDGPWGWKEPNTHLLLDRLAAALPGMKYILVMRNGLDMAYSSNQNQLRLWGPKLLGETNIDVSPRSSLRFWCAAHRRVFSIAEPMQDRFLAIHFEDFCRNPATELPRLLDFLGADPAAAAKLFPMIGMPSSIGRFKSFSLDRFNEEDVLYVKSLGFDTDMP